MINRYKNPDIDGEHARSRRRAAVPRRATPRRARANTTEPSERACRLRAASRRVVNLLAAGIEGWTSKRPPARRETGFRWTMRYVDMAAWKPARRPELPIPPPSTGARSAPLVLAWSGTNVFRRGLAARVSIAGGRVTIFRSC